MKEKRSHGSNFEERLLDELKSVVAQRGAGEESSAETAAPPPNTRRPPRLALGVTAVLATAAAVLLLSSGSDSTPKAFAVEPQVGGGVMIKVYSPEDAAGLEAALREAGIRSQVSWLPAGMTCREPRFTPSTAKSPAGGSIGGMSIAGPGEAMTIGVMSTQQWRKHRREYQRGEIAEDEWPDSTHITLDPAEFRPDQTVVIFGSPGPYDGDPEGGYEAQFAIAEGPVEPCDPVRVSDGGLLESINRVLDSESASSP